MFKDINMRLFGQDDPLLTQLDWINRQSRHQIYLVDGEQSVRPSDIRAETVTDLVGTAIAGQRHYRLSSQMRVRAGQDYVRYVRQVLAGTAVSRETFEGYELRLYDDLASMRRDLLDREEDVGLARMVAGFAWPWKSKKDPTVADIELDGLRLRWNSTDVDWVNAPGSVHEVGSIHTIQGYDLNYAGVIIGRDLRYDPVLQRTVFDRRQYHDPRGTTNNRVLGITYTDADIAQFVRNIYAVLLTRGVLGTFIYVCDPSLREHLRRFF